MPSPELFNPDPSLTPVPRTPDPGPADPLAELVGEGKKFKTVADLAKGKIESDAFIARLLEEQKELRDDLKGRKNLEELAAEFGKLQTPSLEPNVPPSSNNEPSVDEQGTATEDLEQRIENTLTKREAAKKATDNRILVKQQLQKTFGNNFPDKLRLRVAELQLGLSDEDLNNLAGKSPIAFLKTLGISETSSVSAPSPRIESSVNSAGFMPSNNPERTRAYYDRVKEQDRVKYFSPAVQQQMYKDALALGERFFDT